MGGIVKYIIYELVGKGRLEHDGYYTKTIVKYRLEAEELPEEFASITDAEKYIKENTKKYEGCKLIILPVYEIDYEGNLRE